MHGEDIRAREPRHDRRSASGANAVRANPSFLRAAAIQVVPPLAAVLAILFLG